MSSPPNSETPPRIAIRSRSSSESSLDWKSILATAPKSKMHVTNIKRNVTRQFTKANDNLADAAYLSEKYSSNAIQYDPKKFNATRNNLYRDHAIISEQPAYIRDVLDRDPWLTVHEIKEHVLAELDAHRERHDPDHLLQELQTAINIVEDILLEKNAAISPESSIRELVSRQARNHVLKDDDEDLEIRSHDEEVHDHHIRPSGVSSRNNSRTLETELRLLDEEATSKKAALLVEQTIASAERQAARQAILFREAMDLLQAKLSELQPPASTQRDSAEFASTQQASAEPASRPTVSAGHASTPQDSARPTLRPTASANQALMQRDSVDSASRLVASAQNALINTASAASAPMFQPSAEAALKLNANPPPGLMPLAPTEFEETPILRSSQHVSQPAADRVTEVHPLVESPPLNADPSDPRYANGLETFLATIMDKVDHLSKKVVEITEKQGPSSSSHLALKDAPRSAPDERLNETQFNRIPSPLQTFVPDQETTIDRGDMGYHDNYHAEGRYSATGHLPESKPTFGPTGLNLANVCKIMIPFKGDKKQYHQFLTTYQQMVGEREDFDDATKVLVLGRMLQGKAANCLSVARDPLKRRMQTLDNLYAVFGGTEDDQYQLVTKFQKLPFHQTDLEQMSCDLMAHKEVTSQIEEASGRPLGPYETVDFIRKLPVKIRDVVLKRYHKNERNITFSLAATIIQECIQQLRFSEGLQPAIQPESNEITGAINVANAATPDQRHYATPQGTRNQQQRPQNTQPAKDGTGNSASRRGQRRRKEPLPDDHATWHMPANFNLGPGPNLELLQYAIPTDIHEYDRICTICGAGHSPIACPTPYLEARNKVVSQGRCMVCTEAFHQPQACKSTKLCIFCNGRHATALCQLKDFYHALENYPTTAPQISKPRRDAIQAYINAHRKPTGQNRSFRGSNQPGQSFRDGPPRQ